MALRPLGTVVLLSLLLGGGMSCGRNRAPLPEAAKVASGAVIEEFPVLTRGAGPWGIAAARDGTIWFTESRANKIGKFDPKTPALLEEIPLFGAESEPRWITAAPDGAIWFVQSKTKKIARMEPAAPHFIEEFLIPAAMSESFGISADAAGGVWFTETGWRLIARIAARPPHPVTELRLGGYPMGVATDLDGDTWFTKSGWSTVGRIRARSPEEVESFALSVPDGSPTRITAGPGRAMWFLDFKRNVVARIGIDPDHAIKEFEIPPALGTLVDLAAGADGNLWLLVRGFNAVLRFQVDTPHTITPFVIPSAGADPVGIVAGSDGNIWFTEKGTDRIGKVVLSRALGRPGRDAPQTFPARALAEYVPKPPALPKLPLSLSTDLPCIVTVDGVEAGRLRRGSGDTFLVTEGRHVVAAVETDSARSWTRVVEIREGESARAEIRFQPLMENEVTGFRPELPGIQFVSIAGGEFWMGSDRGMPHSSPRHLVRIRRRFDLGKGFVTQAQWKRVMNRNPSPWDLEGDERPAINVSWDDIQDFLERLNRADPRNLYRLPTEAEWEYACRSGSESDILELDKNARLGPGEARANSSSTGPTAWGVSDIRDGLSEWCQDWYDQDYYRRSPSEDPSGPPSGSQKVFRGGAFASNAEGLHPAARGYQDPTSRSTYTGFRVVRLPR